MGQVRDRHIGRQGRLLGTLLVLFVTVMTQAGCTVTDERDECCEELVLHFRYSKGAIDELPRYIHSMSYFFFDGDGILRQRLDRREGEGDLSTLRLKRVDAGRYRVIAVGNAVGATRFEGVKTGESRVGDFLLSLEHRFTAGSGAAGSVPGADSGEKRSGAMGDGDPLYYGSRTYEVEPVTRFQEVLVDMSNVHCRFIATIRWHDTQPSDRTTPFRFELEGVPGTYLQGDAYAIGVSGEGVLESAPMRVVHRFPRVLSDGGMHPLLTHHKEVPYLAGRVKGEMRTLRYTDELVPRFRVMQGEKEVMRWLPLARIFRDMKWAVSENIEQVYELEFTLYDDGRIEVRAGGSLQVLDWINGGTIG